MPMWPQGRRIWRVRLQRRRWNCLPSDTTDPQQQRDAIKASAEGKLKQLEDASQ